jgi:ribosomal protein S18 acetylase RimI-like enzyme
MDRKTIIRKMKAADLAAVLSIQSCCYDESKLESGQSFRAKLEVSPATCFIALVAETPAGYLVAVPAEAGNPPLLNCSNYSIPSSANALYLHDLAVHPEARGIGIADALIDAYFQTLKQSKFQIACLTAVNNSSKFWERYGFRVYPIDARAEKISTYGTGAQYMSMQVRI